MANEVYIGATQTAKSTTVVEKVAAGAARGDYSVVWLDPQAESSALRFLKKATSMGFAKDCIFECMADFDKVLPRIFLPQSKHTDPWERRKQNRITREGFTDQACRKRGFINLDNSPLIREWTDNVCDLSLGQPEQITLDEMMKAFRVGSKDHARLCDSCENEEVAYQFRTLPRNDITLEKILKPAMRFLSPIVKSISVAARDVARDEFPVEEWLDAGKHIIVEAGWNLTEDETRTLLCSLSQRVIDYKRRGGKRWVKMVLEEAGSFRLVGWPEATAMMTLQKRDFDSIVISQIPWFVDEVITQIVFQNSDHYWGRCDDATIARTAAGDIKGIIDPWRVHHVEKKYRQRIVGWEKVPTKNTSSTWRRGSAGRESGGSTTTGEHERPIYEELEEEVPHFLGLNDQVMLLEIDVMQQLVGQRWCKEAGHVYHETLPKPREPWIFPELGKLKAEKAIAQIKQLPYFRVPVLEAVVPSKRESAAARLNGRKGGNGSRNGSKAIQV